MGEVSIMIWENFCRNLRRKRDLELFLRIGKLNVNQSRYRRGADESEIKAETPNIYTTRYGVERNKKSKGTLGGKNIIRKASGKIEKNGQAYWNRGVFTAWAG